MKTSDDPQRVLHLTVEAAVRLGLLALLLFACARIVWPFALPVMWGAILAVALWPLAAKLTGLLGGRRRLAVALLVTAALALLLVPSWALARSMTHGLVSIGSALANGTAGIPAPPDGLADLPLVGDRLTTMWSEARADPPAALRALEPHLQRLGEFVLGKVADLAVGVLLFALSIVLAGVFMARAEGAERAARAVLGRVAGRERGAHMVDTAGRTILSVVKGVLGVSAIQTVAATAGMLVAGVPGAAAWGLLVFVLVVVQLPSLIVLLPVSLWVASDAGVTAGVLLFIWAVVVEASDDVLKPLLLGRGVELPMLVILVGAIGGMLAWGVLGLFVGAVVLGVGWQLARVWFDEPEFAVPSSAEGKE